MKINWMDRVAVVAAAKAMGQGMSVIKRPELANFNIIHTSQEHRLLRDAKVLVRT